MRKRIVDRRPSPGVVLGVIALVAALAGTAVAADPTATTSALSKKKVKKIANKQITKRAPDLAVASADNATNAQNAVNATNATNANNANAVDGHSAVCPAGTFLHNGTCFDTTPTFPNVAWTATDCPAEGGYTPSPSELASIRNETGINLGPAGDGTWTDSRFQDDDGTTVTNMAMTVVDNGTVEADPVGSMRQLICAYQLVR